MTTLHQSLVAALLLLTLLTGCEQPPPVVQLAGGAAKQLPAFAFNDLEGTLRNSSEWKHKVLVVNYWATWCAPCRREIPLFIDTQRQLQANGVQFVGIALDEPHLVQDFVDVYGINFPTLLGDTKAMDLSTVMGNRFQGLPFTAIYDRQGNAHFIHTGELTAETLNRALEPLL